MATLIPSRLYVYSHLLISPPPLKGSRGLLRVIISACHYIHSTHCVHLILQAMRCYLRTLFVVQFVTLQFTVFTNFFQRCCVMHEFTLPFISLPVSIYLFLYFQRGASSVPTTHCFFYFSSSLLFVSARLGHMSWDRYFLTGFPPAWKLQQL